MTDAEVRAAVAAGTTTPARRLRVLYNDGCTALVQHPGGYDGRAPLRDWVPCWVEQYRLDGPIRPGDGLEVWCSAEDGRLTWSRLYALAESLKLDPRCCRKTT